MSVETTIEKAADSLRSRFMQGMRGLAGGVCVIATEHEGERYGLTVTSVCSLSVAPPSVVICVDRCADAHDPICRAAAVTVNVLAASQRGVARLFAGLEAARGPARFEQTGWARSATGLPRLADSLCCLDCEVTAIADGGTHSILIAVVHWGRDFHTIGHAVGHAAAHNVGEPSGQPVTNPCGCPGAAGSDD
jgi:flavin reductase (DIM6/NTAB) family NADH-FMN oxidoreductase RutF